MEEKEIKRKFLIIAVVIAVIIMMITMVIISNDEKTIFSNSEVSYKHLYISGKYTANGETYPLGKRFDLLTGYNDVVIEGFMSDDIPLNAAVYLRVDNMKVHFYVNDTLVFSYGDTGTFLSYSDSPGNGWVRFESPGIRKDDNIRIELQNIYTNHVGVAFNTFIDRIYSDTADGFILSIIRQNLPNIFYTSCIICLGIVLLVSSLTFRFSDRKKFSELHYFGLFVISCGIWFFIDFDTINLLFPSPLLTNCLDYYSLLFTILFILLYVDSLLESRVKLIIRGVIYSCVLYIAAESVLQLTGITDFYSTSSILYTIIFVSIVSVISVMVYEYFIHKNKKAGKNLLSICLIAVGAGIDLTLYVAEILKKIFFVKFFFLIYLIVQLVLLIQALKVSKNAQERALALKGLAYKDPMTSIRNRNAYLEYIEGLSQKIPNVSFGVAVFDLNNLKAVNDKYGHEYGDILITDACRVICKAFKTSPVFRIGGDEFVAILNRESCENRFALENTFYKEVEIAARERTAPGTLSIACGIAVFDEETDKNVEDTFTRADKLMYEKKSIQKERIKQSN